MKLEMKYFILKPEAKSKGDIFAEASQTAMHCYADIIRREHPHFAREIDSWAATETIRQQRMKDE
jgi:hypothetical protein